MPIASVDYVTTAPGSGGALLCGEVFVDAGDSITKFIPWSGLVIGDQNGAYELVGPSNPLPAEISGSVEINDGAGSITVDSGGVPLETEAVQSGEWTVRLEDASNNAIESAVAAPGSGARGLVVRPIGAIDQGAPSSIANSWMARLTNGTVASTLTTVGPNVGLDVNIIGGVGGSSIVDDATFSVGSSTVTVAAGIYRSSRDDVNDGDAGALAMSAVRGLFVVPETQTGDPLADDAINALRMMVVDSAGAQITNFGGGVEYTEGEVDSSIVGRAVMFEDTADTLRPVSAVKPLPVTIISGAGAGGTSLTDDANFTFGTSAATPVGGVYHSTRDPVDVGDMGALAMTQKRALLSCLETPAGDSAMDDTNDAVKMVLYGDGGRVATVRDTGSNDALNVAIVDASGNHVTTFGGGTQYAEDAAHASGDLGTMALAVRRDANTSLVGADGDYAPLQVDANGNLKINLVAGSAAGGTSMTDDAAFTPSTTAFTPVGGTYIAARDPVDNADAGAFGMTIKRAILSSPETPLGDSITNDTYDCMVGSSAFPTAVTGTITGTGATSSIAVSQLGAVSVFLSGSSTAMTCVFEVSSDGGTTWATTKGTKISTRADDPGPVLASYSSSKEAWQVSVAGFTHFRMNCTAASYASVDFRFQGIAETFPSGGTLVDDAAFTVGTSVVTPVGGTYISARDNLDDGDVGAVALTQKRAQFVTPENSAGTELSVPDNAAFVDGTTPVLASGFVLDETAGTALTENDIAAARIDSKRAQVTTIEDATTRGLRATIRDLASNDALNVAVVDGSGNQVTSFASTQFQEDAAHVSGDKGTMALAVRRDADTVMVGSDGDYSPLQTNSVGALKVAVVGGASGGTSMVDDAAFSPGVTSITPAGGTYRTTRDPLDDGDGGAVALNAKRGLFVTLENSASTEVTVVDNAAFTDGTTPVLPAGFVFDDVAGAALTENDAAAARIDSKRAQVLVLEDATTRGTRAKVSTTEPGSSDAGLCVRQVGPALVDSRGDSLTLLASTTVTATGTTALTGLGAGDANGYHYGQFLIAVEAVGGTLTSIGFKLEQAGVNTYYEVPIRRINPGYTKTAMTVKSLATSKTEFFLVSGLGNACQLNVASLTLGSATSVRFFIYTCENVQANPPSESIARAISAASTNLNTAKSSAAVLTGYSIFNSATSPRYVKLYDTASGATVGTTTVAMTLMVPAEGGLNLSGLEVPFETGIQYSITGGMADSDTTAISANDVCLNLFYR